jgi:hypothetical protein
MRSLPLCLLIALSPLAAFAKPESSASEPVPAPAAASAPAAADGALPAAPTLRLRTADGLPIAVEFVSFHRDVVKVRHPSTHRETSLAFSKLDKETQKILTDHAANFCKKVVESNFTTFAFGATAEANKRTKPIEVFPPVGKIGLAEKETDNVKKVLSPGMLTLRINAELPKDVPVDIPVEVKILWGLPPRQSSSSSSRGKTSPPLTFSSSANPSGNPQPETVVLSISNVPGEYYAKPVGISRQTMPEKYWAVVVYNKVTGQILKKAGNTEIHREYLVRNPPNPPSK